MVLLIWDVRLLLWLVHLGLLIIGASILRGDCVHFNLFLVVVFRGSSDVGSLVAILLGIDSSLVHLGLIATQHLVLRLRGFIDIVVQVEDGMSLFYVSDGPLFIVLVLRHL